MATVQLHALSSGHFSLPSHQFISPSSPTDRRTVPSLSFLIQHTSLVTNTKANILFDLGLRKDISQYSEPIRKHIDSRQPMSTSPDVVESLKAGGLEEGDVESVVLSHVHWDHIGQPRDFPDSQFIIGHGSKALLAGDSSSLRGSHSHFEFDLLPESRTIELSSLTSKSESIEQLSDSEVGNPIFNQPWTKHPEFPFLDVMDIFQDESVYVVDAPGHLPGHINLLARVSVSPQHSYIYLAGDACHDRRILRKEKDIGTWEDEAGRTCCIHANREEAQKTIERIRRLEESGVEVIFAHDVEWEGNERNRERFWGGGKGGER
ncbi:hypothetical protein VTL71DRAFT_13137 [Oculimacula yallundae]|uniref:Metallo-beta-lactamase domain-containing protein n=1 Tax=Oculimacula yallundae TaxID=86028 RepID=A0ABR4CPI3_9HELO